MMTSSFLKALGNQAISFVQTSLRFIFSSRKFRMDEFVSFEKDDKMFSSAKKPSYKKMVKQTLYSIIQK